MRDAWSACRRNWWRLVFASVGAVAAVVSYGHIVTLFLGWHQTSLDAHLMPIAIDGLIVIGAGAAKSGQTWLGWSGIGPGLAASLYANVMNGLPHGRAAAMGSGWATIALFVATNIMERWKPAQVSHPVEVAQDGQDEADADPLDFERQAGISTALYRLYDSNHELLYVGISYNPEQRFKSHAARKAWWGDVSETVVKWYTSRAEAALAEFTAIHNEHPKHNKALVFDESLIEPPPATPEPCGHVLTGKPDEVVVMAYLHGRDCLGETPSQRSLSATYNVSRPKVAALVGSLNGNGGITDVHA